MLKPALFSVALIALMSAPALAQDGTPTPPETPAAETPAVETPAPTPPKTLRAGDVAPDGTKVVCRKVKVIGTRFPKRECKSQAAWKQFDAYTESNAKAAADRMQRNANSGAAGN